MDWGRGPTDGQLAADMMAPLRTWSLPDIHEVQALLEDEACSIKLPLSREMYDSLRQSLDPRHTAKLRPMASAGRLVSLMATLLDAGCVQCGADMTSTVTVSFMLERIMLVLKDTGALTLPSFKLTCNKTEEGTSTNTIPLHKQPTHLGIVMAATVYVAEDTSRADIVSAYTSMQSYMEGGLNSNHYGDLRYIFGHVASGPDLRFLILTADGSVMGVSGTFDLNCLPGRINAVCTIIGIYRLMELMLPRLPSVEQRTQPLLLPVTRGRTVVTLNPKGALKQIHDFKSFAEDNFTSAGELRDAYDCAATAAALEAEENRQPFLVTAVGEPDITSTRSEQHYAVQTQPLGYCSHPSGEQDVRRLGLACCKAAQVLHTAGLVLRDFRLKNMVRLSPTSWMVIDLELCSKAPLQLPSHYTQDEWTDATCSVVGEQRTYTAMSDMHQIGRMLSKLLQTPCSAAGLDFTEALLDKKLSAEQALSHERLQGL